MRKLYAFCAILLLELASFQLSAQTVTPDHANFTWSAVPGTTIVQFTNTSTLGTATGTRQAYWYYGDGLNGNTGALENTQHQYATGGTYTVCLKIFRYFGTGDSALTAQECKVITTNTSTPDSCTADFERLLTASSPPRSATFKALPWNNHNRKPSRVCWEFGDGQDTCINYSSTYTGQYLASHQYASNGNYQVCVKIFYFEGCIAYHCRMINIESPDSCRADFEEIPATVASPLSKSFRALLWHSQNKRPLRICWRFGDGTDTCVNYPAGVTGPYTINHTYTSPGTYEVCVNILYDGGCESHKCRQVIVNPPSCSVHLFEVVPSVTSLVRGFLAVTGSTPSRHVQQVCWRFGDGSDTCIINPPGSTTTNFTISHTYPGPGTYRACVRVVFEGGCVAEECREVVIRASTNVCGGYMTDSLAGARTFVFRGFSINIPADEVLSYQWSFGDGTSGTGRNVTHTYVAGGIYNVCLVIRTRLGCETRICKPLHMPGTNSAVLQLSPNPVITNLHVNFFSTHTETVVIRIMNSSGIVVRMYSRNVVAGMNSWDHDLAGLLPGIYNYVIQSPNQMASGIFMKQ